MKFTSPLVWMVLFFALSMGDLSVFYSMLTSPSLPDLLLIYMVLLRSSNCWEFAQLSHYLVKLQHSEDLAEIQHLVQSPAPHSPYPTIWTSHLYKPSVSSAMRMTWTVCFIPVDTCACASNV